MLDPADPRRPVCLYELVTAGFPLWRFERGQQDDAAVRASADPVCLLGRSQQPLCMQALWDLMVNTSETHAQEAAAARAAAARAVQHPVGPIELPPSPSLEDAVAAVALPPLLFPMQVFQGWTVQRMTCLACNRAARPQFEPFCSLILAIDGRGLTTVEQCVAAFRKPAVSTNCYSRIGWTLRLLACRTLQEMRGVNQYACGFCNVRRDASSQLSIVGSAPRLLTVHLKRFTFSAGRGTSKNSKKIKFGLQLVLPVAPNRPEEPDAVRDLACLTSALHSYPVY